jgi:plastocyanin
LKYAFATFSLAALLLAGCSAHSSAPAVVSQPGNNIATIPISDGPDITTVKHVGARLTGETGITDPRYGFVIGYFKGKTSTISQIVSLPTATQVKFFNVDTTRPHTVSFLGNATKSMAPWPPSFNGSSTKSPAGTDIGTSGFSTGTLLPGKASAVYNTGPPGFYMVGCAFHYNTNMMRTVIIVK